MVINMNDPRILAEWDPPTIKAVGAALRGAYGTSADAVGIRGNNVHNSGYHRSENWIRNSPDSRDHDADYSLQGSLNVSADRNAVCALDFTPGSWGTSENRRRMIELTTRMRNAALAHDPRLSNVFEFAGTLNGSSVVTFRCSDGAARSPFDSSHLDHCHISFYRARALNNHDGVTAVLLGGTDLDTTEHGWLDEDRRWSATGMRAAVALAKMTPTWKEFSDNPASEVQYANGLYTMLTAMQSQLTALSAAVTALSTGGTSIDTAAVISAINAAKLTPQQVHDAALAAAQEAEDS